MNQNLLLGAKDRPQTSKWILLSFQHVFAMFGATVLVPILTGLPISVALFASGIGINNSIVGQDMVLRICETHFLNNGETETYETKDLDEYRNRRAK